MKCVCADAISNSSIVVETEGVWMGGGGTFKKEKTSLFKEKAQEKNVELCASSFCDFTVKVLFIKAQF